MSEPLLVWAKVTLRLGLVLLAVGLIPLILQQFVLTDISPIVPVLLSVMVAPSASSSRSSRLFFSW